MFHKLTDTEIRGYCKEKLESLEYWLRRIIDETLSAAYGDYFNYVDQNGTKIIKSEILKTLTSRRNSEPDRYPRLIDAVLLDDAIDIICKPPLYTNYFRVMLKDAFPDGREEARTFMKRVVPPRNALAHANPISVRQAEQICCYTNDIIDSIKSYYRLHNMNSEYNVPLILKVIDSFGNVFYRGQMSAVHDGGIALNLATRPKFNLQVGDTLTIEVEVDPSFAEEDYTITWGSSKGFSEPMPIGKKAAIAITDKQVAQIFDVQCNIKSNKTWHRMSMGVDDFLIAYYKVLPPS
jgi:hypothetical protein